MLLFHCTMCDIFAREMHHIWKQVKNTGEKVISPSQSRHYNRKEKDSSLHKLKFCIRSSNRYPLHVASMYRTLRIWNYYQTCKDQIILFSQQKFSGARLSSFWSLEVTNTSRQKGRTLKATWKEGKRVCLLRLLPCK